MAHELESCIHECQQCHSACESTIEHCLQQGGPHAAADHVRLLADCSQICTTSADFMLRNSPMHELTCGVCADVCEQCAQSCEQLGDDPMMQQCAEVCHRCAESCREMAGAAG